MMAKTPAPPARLYLDRDPPARLITSLYASTSIAASAFRSRSVNASRSRFESTLPSGIIGSPSITRIPRIGRKNFFPLGHARNEP